MKPYRRVVVIGGKRPSNPPIAGIVKVPPKPPGFEVQ